MRLKILFLLAICTLPVYSQTDKKNVKSEVKSVKIFLSGAQVNRLVKTTVEAGVTQLVVENLSPHIDANSIGVSLAGEAMVQSTSFSLDYLKENMETPELKRLKDSLEILTNDMNELNVLKSVYSEEIGMLNANKAIGGSNVGVNAENLQKAIDFYRSRMIELKTKIADIDKKQVKLSEKIKRVNDQIAIENGKINQPSGTIFINVSAKQRSPVEIELSYYTMGTSWQPSYDISAKDVKSSIHLLYKATVSQSTGENWENVRFSLSTGNPSLGGNKPSLNPWYLRYRSQVYMQQGVPEPEMRGSRSKSLSDDAQSAPAMHEEVIMEENQLVTDFEIQIPYTVMSDGKQVSMDIQSFTLPATFSYYATPKLDKDAFLLAGITGWEKLNLLPGSASVYLENGYTGESYINPSETNDTLKLSFGRDKRIMIKRDMVKDMNTTKFIGGNVEKEFLYEITVKNTKKENITITIDDQVPLITDESMKVSAGELSKGNYSETTGIVNWNLSLLPGETRKVLVGFKIKYPKDKVIIGL
jgi:uncharacterized protein (TIGR02231 family)